MPLLKTLQSCEPIGRFIADIVLYIMCYFAQAEREMCHVRQAEAIAAAKASVVKFGRRRKDRPHELEELIKLWQAKEISANNAAKRLNVSRNTFLKWARESGQKSIDF